MKRLALMRAAEPTHVTAITLSDKLVSLRCLLSHLEICVITLSFAAVDIAAVLLIFPSWKCVLKYVFLNNTNNDDARRLVYQAVDSHSFVLMSCMIEQFLLVLRRCLCVHLHLLFAMTTDNPPSGM